MWFFIVMHLFISMDIKNTQLSQVSYIKYTNHTVMTYADARKDTSEKILLFLIFKIISQRNPFYSFCQIFFTFN